MTWPGHLVLATGNADKVAEWRHRLVGFSHTVEWRDLPSPVEDAATYEGNALLKARAAALATGLPALGDDVGLEVDVFDGAPGLETRRWAEDLGGWEAARDALARIAGSRATYCCGLALVHPDGRELTALGAVRGTVVQATVSGPGTEPCFVADGTDVALPALPADVHNRVHHRSVAFRTLCDRVDLAAWGT